MDTDVVVLGGTPAGIAAAVRTAREGLATELVAYNDHLGGCLPSLGGIETLYQRPRAPVVDEVTERIRDHYRSAYGADSPQFETCTADHVSFEPHVAEEVLEAVVAAEQSLTVRRGCRLSSVERDGDEVRSIRVRPVDGGDDRRVAAATFVDATYEGDLAAAAGVPCRVGRESRTDFGEQHAGRLFASAPGEPTADIAEELNLAAWTVFPRGVMPGSTGAGDDAVQAYQYRLCLSRDPETRRYPAEPSGYDRDRYVGLVDDSRAVDESVYVTDLESVTPLESTGKALPNDKLAFGYNATNLLGGSREYPGGDWKTRDAVARRHREHALGLLYFLQTDEAVPDDVREDARQWGLATDEYTDRDNLPGQLYVREARRIRGRTVFAENDARLAEGIDRAPVRADSVAIAGDWFLDSHGCTTERRQGAIDGAHMLPALTRPCHVPYRALLPEVVENLLVPVALSATHVGFGTIRLEPPWMHIGEAAGFAAALAARRDVRPGRLDTDALQRALVENRVVIAFFNDVEVTTDEPRVPAVQYLGAKGYFASYDARPDAPLRPPTAREWARTFGDQIGGDHDPTAAARRVAGAPASTESVTGAAFVAMLREQVAALEDAPDPAAALDACGIDGDSRLSRGQATRLVYEAL